MRNTAKITNLFYSRQEVCEWYNLIPESLISILTPNTYTRDCLHCIILSQLTEATSWSVPV